MISILLIAINIISVFGAYQRTKDSESVTGPNFILFFIDDLLYTKTWDDAGLAPSKHLNGVTLEYLDIPTPNMNEIMNEGIVFKRAYSGSAKCSPSRYALLTGRYPVRSKYGIKQTIATDDVAYGVKVSVPYTKMYEDDGIYNLPKTLQNNGYITGQTGKWHLYTADDIVYRENVGCSKLGSSVDEDIYNKCRAIVQEQGFDFVDALYTENIDSNNEYFSHNPEWMVSQSQKFIEQSQKENKSFFLYFSSTLTHSPKIIKDNVFLFDYTQTPKGILSGDEIPDDTTMHTREEIMEMTLETLSDAGYDTSDDTIVQNACSIIWIDDAIGALLTYLKNNELYDNTFIIIMNDHGQEAKGTLFEHGTRVIQFIRYPSLFGTDGHIIGDDFVVANYDLPSVIFDVAGITTLPSEYIMDGENWLNDVLGEIDRGDGASNTCCNERYVDMLNSHSIITNTHKYIFNARSLENKLYKDSSDMEQMYRLNRDPGEQNNLIPSDNPETNNAISLYQRKMIRYIENIACVADDVNHCIKPGNEYQTNEDKNGYYTNNANNENRNVEYVEYRGLGGLQYIDNENGLLGNHNSLILLTVLSLLMLFNTLMILKFQFCGLTKREGNSDRKQDEINNQSDDISDQTDDV